MKELKTFNYESSSITFQRENGDIMVNLTEMAKPFGKMPAHFLSNTQTKEFIVALEESFTIGIPIVVVQNGGINPGTWAHQKLALKFAAWLHPKFELWVYDRIEELMRQGYTKLDTINRKELALMLLQAEEDREKMEKELQIKQARLELQDAEIRKATPKVEYYNEVLQSDSLIATNVIAKELGMTAIALNQFLKKKGVIYKSNHVWVTYSKYQNMGFTGTKTYVYKDSTGAEKTQIQTYWTEKGRVFIHSLVEKEMEVKHG